MPFFYIFNEKLSHALVNNVQESAMQELSQHHYAASYTGQIESSKTPWT